MLFQVYGDNSFYQLIGWVMVFAGLIITNEIQRRYKAGGCFFFFVLPAALTAYFIAIYIGAANGASWADLLHWLIQARDGGCPLRVYGFTVAGGM